MSDLKKNLLIILIAAEFLSVLYCIDTIFTISEEHRIARTTDAITECLSVSVMDAEDPVADGKVAYDAYIEELNRWKGPVLSPGRGVNYGPSGKETYYNLNMSGVVSIMRSMGNTDEYWVRDDGCKMLGDYIMVAANLNLRPRGSIVETSLGDAIVCDTGGFAKKNPTQIDIAVTW
ncbi:MAG: hypothetical protein IJH43_05230 [Mogibacterium sp.]|nr:hypothetical protein [Mogibacterium sp.]